MRNSLRSKPCEIEASPWAQQPQPGLFPALPAQFPPSPGSTERRVGQGEGTRVPQRVTPKHCGVGYRPALQSWLGAAGPGEGHSSGLIPRPPWDPSSSGAGGPWALCQNCKEAEEASSGTKEPPTPGSSPLKKSKSLRF